MIANLVTINFSAQAQVAANGVHGVTVPKGCTLVGVSMWVEALTGSPTNINIDIQDDGTDIITAGITLTAAGAGTWLTPTLGGTNTALNIASGSVVEVDVNFTAGSTPTADYDITLWLLMGGA